MTELRISEGDVAALPVLPLWIGGHAYLSVCQQYGILLRAQSGVPVRRFPVCGEAEVARACESARGALVAGAGGAASTEDCWCGWAGLVERYHGHLTGLLQEESGWAERAAADEVSAAAACLRDTGRSGQCCLAAIGPSPAAPISGLLRVAVPILRSGGAVIAVSSPNAPSVLVALAELSARAGLRPGAFSLLHGDTATWATLGAQSDVTVFAGAPAPV
ncbi:hypothetical protein [Propionivibrio dicarboxylicus]|uniref:Aldehyde dehydrogenase family protein n=1 Tax=Propionivibrio dicarboxylicus TaxID=83767 RepID=A0A1G8FJS5_9RHOO|nr:hypothetical protein [Propionivibrio dicarboxylicus]SDH82368.1 hypothetical protein SAMN05660652_02346 [Propionivibrio dicarboxylicus]